MRVIIEDYVAAGPGNDTIYADGGDVVYAGEATT